MKKRLGTLLSLVLLAATLNATVTQSLPCGLNGGKNCVPRPGTCGAPGQSPCPRVTPPAK